MRWCICAVRWRLTLKPGMHAKANCCHGSSSMGLPRIAPFTCGHPGKGNKPLHDLRIERAKGFSRSEKYRLTACFSRLQAVILPFLRLLRTHAERSSSSSSSVSGGFLRRLTGSKPSKEAILIIILSSVSLCAQGRVSALAALTVNNAEPARGRVFDGFAVYGVVNAIQLQIAPVGGVKVSRPESCARFSFHCLIRDFIRVSGGFWWSCHVLFRPIIFKRFPCTKI